ncbi:MAG TPA: SpoIIE family protein phosphatase [Thermoanaerobaculia bacterium]
MPLAELLSELQQIERVAAADHGPLILGAFAKHTPFDSSAIYLRESREAPLRLAATRSFEAPDVLSDDQTLSSARLLVPLRTTRDQVGMLALSGDTATDEDVRAASAAASYLATLIANHRLLQETREGDFQLKYRLWELESLYDIGLSITATLNIDDLADEILFRMISLINARRAALFLRDGPGFRLYRSFGEVRSDFLDEDLAQQLVREGVPLTFEKNTDCIFPSCMAYVALPIRGNSDVIGVLAAADRETRDGGIGAFEANELRLLSLFASQVAIALENARLHREALEKQAMERELELAATIQRDILPKAIPEVEGIEIATLSRPAKQVGGDYHAFFVRDGVLTMLVGDVAGKSMPAALLVSALHAATQLLFAEGRELGDVATELNRHIHNWSAENKFVTMVIVSIDRENETLDFVNAGHNPAYIVHDGKLDQIRSHGLPIGILPTTRYSTQRRPFPPGSAVVLYSDGITEAEDVAGEEFENARLEEILAGDMNVSELRDHIAAAVDQFTIGAPQKDDQTLVIARSL